MEVRTSEIPGVVIVTPRRFGDSRGFFAETFRAESYAAAGMPHPFVQENWSRSGRGVLRGLHLQNPMAQGKLVSVIRGRVFDVAVDVRRGSPSFGRHVAVELSDDNGVQMFVPRGCAHGFVVLSETADFVYKCDEYYSPQDEIVVRWNDPALGIAWPVSEPLVSARDAAGHLLADVPQLPSFAA
jgi:dTDP-4-dehydrorhamnose 3,5-epimerase